MANSNPVTTKTIAAGIIKQTWPIEPPKIINQINPAKIFNNV